MEKYQGIIIHPYIARQNKKVLLITNATVDRAELLMSMLNIAENLCTCSNEDYEKLLPIFKEFYSLVGNANKEIEFIKEQRKGKVTVR